MKKGSAPRGERSRSQSFQSCFCYLLPHLAGPHLTLLRSDDAIVFEKAKQQLLESMKKFRALTAGSKGTEVTCWDDVASAAAVALSQWEAKAKDSRVGRVKEWVRKMCNGMNNHATALKMLPSESEYVSLVAGSVSMIIKV